MGRSPRGMGRLSVSFGVGLFRSTYPARASGSGFSSRHPVRGRLSSCGRSRGALGGPESSGRSRGARGGAGELGGVLYSPAKFYRIYSLAHFPGHFWQIRFSRVGYFYFFRIFSGPRRKTPLRVFPSICYYSFSFCSKSAKMIIILFNRVKIVRKSFENQKLVKRCSSSARTARTSRIERKSAGIICHAARGNTDAPSTERNEP